jgi:beta-galactosidase
MVKFENGKILIDGKETMLYGGELHYFRVPRKEWGDRIQKIKDIGGNLVSTYVPWAFHEMEEGKIDLTGKTREEKDFVSFLKLVQEMEMYCLVRPGPYVMAEIVDHGVPTWFIAHYPEAVAKTQNGDIHPARVVSYMHPVFLQKVENWYRHVCEIIEPFQIQNGGPVILFQLDNEVGMFHWVTNQADYNDITLNYFADYLQSKFTLDEFCKHFNIRVNSIEEFVREKVKHVEEHYAFPLHKEWGLFHREYYKLFIQELKKLAEKYGIRLSFVINVHGFHTEDLEKRGTMYPIGLSQLLEAMKIENVMTAGDYYIGNIEYDSYIDIILANAFTKAVQSKDQPLFSAEFQGGSIPDRPRLQPTTFDLTTRLCIANGMDAINFYMFVGGENYEGIGICGRRHEWQAPVTADGSLRPHYHKIAHIGRMLSVFGDKLVQTKPQYDSHLGFYPDYFMTEFHNSFTKKMTDEIKQSREMNLYNGLVKGLVHNVKEIPVLWVFSVEWMDEKVQKKLLQYVQNGGKLVLFPTIPTKDFSNKPCTILLDALKVELGGVKRNAFIQVHDIDSISTSKVQMFRTKENVFSWVEETKETVAFTRAVGNGTVVVFGVSTLLDYEYKKDVFKILMNMVGVTPIFETKEDVDVSIRTSEKGESFLFVHNFDEYEKETTIIKSGEALFDGKPLTIRAKSGLMLPLNVSLRDDFTIDYSTVECVKFIEKENVLQLTVCPIAKEETLKITSSTWKPKENDYVKVVYSGNTSIIFIRSYDEQVEIEFVKDY